MVAFVSAILLLSFDMDLTGIQLADQDGAVLRVSQDLHPTGRFIVPL